MNGEDTADLFFPARASIMAATVAAFEEAFDIIKRDPHLATQIYIAREPQKRDAAWIEAMITNPKQITFSSTPRGTKDHADFMHAIGTLKNQPESWKDLFWENETEKDGS